jgi:hypothetical protein
MTPPHNYHERTAKVRWIVGIRPFIIAIGNDDTNYLDPPDIDVSDHFHFPNALALVRIGDTKRIVTRLFILERLPPSAGEWVSVDSFRQSIQQSVKEVTLENATSLDDVLNLSPGELEKLAGN